MSPRPKVIWPHPSPLHDWWTQIMESTAARLSAHRSEHEVAPETPDAVADEAPPEPESPSRS